MFFMLFSGCYPKFCKKSSITDTIFLAKKKIIGNTAEIVFTIYFEHAETGGAFFFCVNTIVFWLWRPKLDYILHYIKWPETGDRPIYMYVYVCICMYICIYMRVCGTMFIYAYTVCYLLINNSLMFIIIMLYTVYLLWGYVLWW